MSTDQAQVRYSKVTLAISGAADAADMIEAASRLARAANARLHGLLLEDKTLFDLAELPFSASIAPGPVPAREPLTAAGLEAAFAKQERILRQLIAAAAGSGDLDWTFARHRGAMSDLVISTREDELLLVCGDAATNEAESAFASVGDRRDRIGGFGILKPRALKKPGPILAILRGGPGAAQTSMIVQKLAASTGSAFKFLLPANNEEEAAVLDEWARSIFDEHSQGGSFLALELSEGALAAEIATSRPSLIVGDLCSWPFDNAQVGERIIRSCGCPLVLLRCRSNNPEEISKDRPL